MPTIISNYNLYGYIFQLPRNQFFADRCKKSHENMAMRSHAGGVRGQTDAHINVHVYVCACCALISVRNVHEMESGRERYYFKNTSFQ